MVAVPGASLDLPPNQLRTFLTVARRPSYTRAAEELHLTQPAVSIHIRKLERAVGGMATSTPVSLLYGPVACTYFDCAGTLVSRLFRRRPSLRLRRRAMHESAAAPALAATVPIGPSATSGCRRPRS